MRYYIKRYQNGIRKIRKWLPLALLPCLIYIIAAGLSADRFSIIQAVSVDLNSPVALSRTPVDVVPMSEIAAGREALFLDDFAVIDLSRRLQKETALKEVITTGRELRKIIEDAMTLKAPDSSHLEIGYYGADPEVGRLLVEYFSKKLVMRNQEGIARTMRYNRPGQAGVSFLVQRAGAGVPGPAGETSEMRPASAVGEARTTAYKAFWRTERLRPTLLILAFSVFVMAIITGVVEWSDPSLKSVRQAARYLNIPVLGSIPDLHKLGDALYISSFDEAG
ncbi:MAG: hypothetical protein COZ70_13645 [Deltaproteobacteria bacterium CG_4_8_14_3_um_filter_51_11]|nr:MAG: hypothetical protein COX16_10060 [Deltaproteobacteria bacterium CG23_combo_of_CG06-09_8_20_14_all_51_20]PIX18547.1 MAG: hypothetical protein COZ70_13645 [Deltaproteobacteria bacterium CG_4_8_14_3_um_filter_51_11]